MKFDGYVLVSDIDGTLVNESGRLHRRIGKRLPIFSAREANLLWQPDGLQAG